MSVKIIKFFCWSKQVCRMIQSKLVPDKNYRCPIHINSCRYSKKIDLKNALKFLCKMSWSYTMNLIKHSKFKLRPSTYFKKYCRSIDHSEELETDYHLKNNLIQIGGSNSPFFEVNNGFVMWKKTHEKILRSDTGLMYQCAPYLPTSKHFVMTELLIPDGTRIYINNTSYKKRVSLAHVNNQYSTRDKYDYSDASDIYSCSYHDPNFLYEYGEAIQPHTFYDYKNWEESGFRDATCKPGIHAFFTYEKAENYVFDELNYITHLYDISTSYISWNQDIVLNRY